LPRISENVPEAYRTALARLRASIDLSRLDPAALQTRLGTDPRTLARFIQEEVRFEAYAGCLRGPTGTLLAGAGNAVDRAWLLAALLRAAGHRVRFAAGTLSSEQAEVLVRSGLTPQPSRPGTQPFLDAIAERSASHFLLLGDALYAAGFRAPSGDLRQWEEAVRAAREHTWVQVDEQGRWVDVDTSPGAGYGRSLVPPQQVTEILDGRCAHTVEFRLEAEILQEGRRVRETVLTFATTAAALAGVPVGLFHEVNGNRTVPLLLVGERLYRGTSFQVGEEPQPAGGLFPLPGVGSARETRRSLSGEWLHVRVRGPAGERAVTYTIADALGPAARNGGPGDSGAATPVGELDGVVGLGVISGGVPPILPAAILSTVDDPLTQIGLARLLSALSFGYAAVRGLLPSSPVNPQPLRSTDFPNIVIAHARPAGGTSRPRLTLDLALKAYRLLRPPEDLQGAQAHFYDYLYNGVLDHTAERAIFGRQDADTSVGALFEAAVDQDIAVRVLSGQGADPGSLLTADGRFRVAAALSAGRMVLLPGARPRGWPEGGLGWWSVDPATGWTEDTTEGGEHQAGSERAVQEKDTPKKIQSVCSLSGLIIPMLAVFITALANWTGVEFPPGFDPADVLDATSEVLEKRCGGSNPPLPKPQEKPPFPRVKKMPPPPDLNLGKRRWFPWQQPGRR